MTPDTSPDRAGDEERAGRLAADERERQRRSGRSAAAARIHDKATYVDQQVRVAMARGDFDDLPGAGKPIEGLGGQHDPDWWLKKLIERENITLLPLSTQLRREDADLDERLDALLTEPEVRRVVADFNARVIAARYRAPEGPPLVTMPRDVDQTVAGWQDRREARRAAQRERLAEQEAERAAARAALPTWRRWLRRA